MDGPGVRDAGMSPGVAPEREAGGQPPDPRDICSKMKGEGGLRSQASAQGGGNVASGRDLCRVAA